MGGHNTAVGTRDGTCHAIVIAIINRARVIRIFEYKDIHVSIHSRYRLGQGKETVTATEGVALPSRCIRRKSKKME